METSVVRKDVRTWCVLSHASALLGFVIPWVFHILGPLIVWLTKRDDSPEIDAHGKESLNFQITLALIIIVLCITIIGILLLWLVGVLALVLVIIATIRASEGKLYKYPVNIRFIK